MKDLESLKKMSTDYSVNRYINTDISPKEKAAEIIKDYAQILSGLKDSAQLVISCSERVADELIYVTGSKYWYSVKNHIQNFKQNA
jgi:hypothetical protein